METKKCPNCGGELEKKRDRWVCPYCNSSYEAEASGQSGDGGQFHADLFYVDADMDKLMAKKNTAECIKMWKYCLDEMSTAGEIEDYIRKITVKDDGTAMNDIRSERISALMGRIGQELQSGERIILLVDTTLFGKGKEFYVVTDRACRFFTKKKTWSVNIDDIVSLKINDSLNLPSFYLNDNYENTISSVGNSNQTLGAMLALISRLAFEQSPDRTRIRIAK